MFFVVVALTAFAGGCNNEDRGAAGILQERRPDVAYEKLFPYYVELCATSQYRSKTKAIGGPFGHAVMYIKGACKDEKAPFPSLRRCRSQATSLDDPEHGAGVSVNRWLKNANWLAIPGYKLFYEGNLTDGQRLTEAHFTATVRDAIDKGVFHGVELHEYPTEAKQRNIEDFAAYRSIGTDFALRYARTNFCSRLPITEPMLEEIIAFLNDKNREYFTGEAEYNWNGLSDNCVHTVRNALAAANVWEPTSVWAVRFRRLFNLAVPANEFANLAILGAEGNVADYKTIQEDGPLRDALHEFHWLPKRHGALLKTLPVHEPNDLFETRLRLFLLRSPFAWNKRAKAIELLSDKRFVELEANLRYFKNYYKEVLARHYKDFDGLESVRGSEYRRIQRLHYQYMREQLAEVESMLASLAENTR